MNERAVKTPEGGDADDDRRTLRVPMRWKLLGAFAGAFTAVFAFIAIWVVNYTAGQAETRLVTELHNTAQGGARTIDGDELHTLVTTVPPVPDPNNPSGLGYPDSPLYTAIAQQLLRIRDIIPEASPYSYFRDEADGKLYFAVSAGYLFTPPFGVTYKVPVSSTSDAQTYDLMMQGLQTTTNEPAYTDAYGSWISSFSPITDSAGTVVGAIGIDYPTTYVKDVRDASRSRVVPVLLISYLVLLVLVLLLSNGLVRPLRRLTAAAKRVEEGDYDLDVASLVHSRFPDEMYELGESFARMAEKVGAREKSLNREVQRLKVEIDMAKKEQAVKEITETDFFSDLAAKAQQLRQRMREEP